ncbi:triple gene block 1 protein [Phlox virus S]|uniref:Triple gene block 1 protein n=1 Tax=Phlox virus S TaxID=436066 RepID=A4ZWC6_9VIRU|nr:triple gene block 1 protein [Phlox virus S]ABP37857.1 triple gene block 1 protein [Phlox virus S]
MDILVSLLCKYKFERLNSKLCLPIIVNCVPGAGKSSCIRELISSDSRFCAYTLGTEDPQNLRGVRIKSFKGEIEEGKFNVLDEYTLSEVDLSKFFVCFGDPIQANSDFARPADFICRDSKRFGKCTATLLQNLGFDIKACGEDSVQIAGIYSEDPRDTVLYHEEEVGCLLAKHCVEAFHISEVVGRTFESVTFVTSHAGVDHPDRAAAFQCLTRHRKSLLILCPDATYGPP